MPRIPVYSAAGNEIGYVLASDLLPLPRPAESATTCSKCGGTDLSRSYHNPNARRDEPGHRSQLVARCTGGDAEHLDVTCRRCQWAWTEETRETKGKSLRDVMPPTSEQLDAALRQAPHDREAARKALGTDSRYCSPSDAPDLFCLAPSPDGKWGCARQKGHKPGGGCVYMIPIDESARRSPPPVSPACRACGKPLDLTIDNIADGCPCNSPRGINHGLVARHVCTCVECDAEQTGSVRKPPVSEPVSPRGADTFPLTADDVEWVINDLSELGVKIGSRFFFLYKGRSLVYKDAVHDDDGLPMQWRPVFKREFGETCKPVGPDGQYRLASLTDGGDWQLLPSSPPVAPADDLRTTISQLQRDLATARDLAATETELRESAERSVEELIRVAQGAVHRFPIEGHVLLACEAIERTRQERDEARRIATAAQAAYNTTAAERDRARAQVTDLLAGADADAMRLTQAVRERDEARAAEREARKAERERCRKAMCFECHKGTPRHYIDGLGWQHGHGRDMEPCAADGMQRRDGACVRANCPVNCEDGHDFGQRLAAAGNEEG